LFGDDFIKFKQFLTEGYFLQIRGRVGERFRKEGDWEFKITSMHLLSELRDKLTKCITIQIPIEDINDELISSVDELIEENKSSTEEQNCLLHFAVYDREQGVLLDLPSKSLKINPSNRFLERLTALNITNYKLN
jgi:DNA polymerase-3 subunit alpha